MNQEQWAIVRIRYIARSQLSTTLKLFPDLCLRVLDEYGCATEIIANPNTWDEEEHSVVVASWPRPGKSERGQYHFSILPRMVEKVLELTEEADAGVAADAIGEVLKNENGN